jgi:capsular polysaccharide biosynthesis protein
LEKENFEQEIDLREYLQILKRRWWMIALITLLVVLATVVYTFFVVTPMYESSTTVMVSSPVSYSAGTVDMNELNLNRRLAETYGEIVRSRRVASEVIEDMNLDLTPTTFNNKIQVSQVRDTEFIRISVTDPSPSVATAIANNTAEAFKSNVVEIMNVDNVSTLDEATEPTSPVSPNEQLNIAIGVVLGLMLGVFLVFIREYFDNTIKTKEDVSRYLELPVIGSIPSIQD